MHRAHSIADMRTRPLRSEGFYDDDDDDFDTPAASRSLIARSRSRNRAPGPDGDEDAMRLHACRSKCGKKKKPKCPKKKKPPKTDVHLPYIGCNKISKNYLSPEYGKRN